MENFKIISRVGESLLSSSKRGQEIVIPVSYVDCRGEERVSFFKIKVKEIKPLGLNGEYYFYGYIYPSNGSSIYVDGFTEEPKEPLEKSFFAEEKVCFGRLLVY